uniref:Uncharacterized protein n=1 Tax=Cacopsylla melanoneura TaxID=428564 RepID=A0A8D8TM07_9HEMI
MTILISIVVNKVRPNKLTSKQIFLKVTLITKCITVFYFLITILRILNYHNFFIFRTVYKRQFFASCRSYLIIFIFVRNIVGQKTFLSKKSQNWAFFFQNEGFRHGLFPEIFR